MRRKEVWLPVPKLPGVFASSRGRIKWRGVIIRQVVVTTTRGYQWVYVSVRARNVKVARLVLSAFKGLPTPPNNHGLHKDDDPFNNAPSNLYWGTPADNAADRVRNGRMNPARGEAVGSAVLTEAIVCSARKRYVPGCPVNGINAMAREYGITEGTLCSAIGGRTWKHVEEPPVYIQHQGRVLTDDIVRAVRKRYVPRHPVNGVNAMAREFGVDPAAMSRAVRGIWWKHV